MGWLKQQLGIILSPRCYEKPKEKTAQLASPFFYPSEEARQAAAHRYGRHNPAASALRQLAILEPSAGNGAIVDELTGWLDRQDYHSRSSKQHVYCCEADPDLRAVLHEKGYKVIANDFLTYRGDLFSTS